MTNPLKSLNIVLTCSCLLDNLAIFNSISSSNSQATMIVNFFTIYLTTSFHLKKILLKEFHINNENINKFMTVIIIIFILFKVLF